MITSWWLTVFSALALPTLCGGLIVMSMLRCQLRATATVWSMAAGHILGLGLAALLMAVYRFAGLTQYLLPLVSGSLLIAGGLAGLLIVRRSFASARREAGQMQVLPPVSNKSSDKAGRAATAVWWLLVIWMSLIALLIFSEALIRPVYPWDAWSAWSVKARVWAELGPTVDFVGFAQWAASDHADVFTNEAWSYPETLPLIQLWMTGWFGGWDSSAAHLPWASCGLALLVLIYHSCRMLRVGALGSAIATFLVMSAPILTTQLALAGYADIWMCAALALFVACLLGQLSQWLSPLATWLSMALACSLKLEGVIWAFVAMATALMCRLSQRARIQAAVATLALALLWWFSGGFSFTLGGHLVLMTPDIIQVPYLGRYPLGFDNQIGSLLTAFVALPNWHLLWVFGLPAAAMAIWNQRSSQEGVGLAIFLFLGLGFLFVLFFYTQAAVWAESMTASNRLALHLVPAAGLWTAVLLQRQSIAR